MFTLTDEMINENKVKFIELLRCISRDGASVDKLITKLENSDFFIAPASTKYHGAFKGGLCDHSLNVYYNLCSLVKSKHLEDVISQESVAIVGLLHDISKMNFYKIEYRNKKVYSDYGSKKDENGKFDWVSEKSYAVADEKERFIYGNHEETSEYMIRQFIPLTYDESASILSHHGGMAFDSTQADISRVYNRYPLATLLHLADMLSTYIDERV